MSVATERFRCLGFGADTGRKVKWKLFESGPSEQGINVREGSDHFIEACGTGENVVGYVRE